MIKRQYKIVCFFNLTKKKSWGVCCNLRQNNIRQWLGWVMITFTAAAATAFTFILTLTICRIFPFKGQLHFSALKIKLEPQGKQDLKSLHFIYEVFNAIKLPYPGYRESLHLYHFLLNKSNKHVSTKSGFRKKEDIISHKHFSLSPHSRVVQRHYLEASNFKENHLSRHALQFYLVKTGQKNKYL